MEKPLRILIVEDEFITADVLRDYLIELNYEVVGIAKDALEAIDILDQKMIDFAILDIHIQGSRNGIWLANKINKEYKIPFIFLTANSDKVTVTEAIDTHPNGYLVKPFQKSNVYTTIEVGLKNFHNSNNQDQPHLDSNHDHIFIKSVYGHKKIKINEILFIKSDLKNIEIHFENELHIIRYSLSDFINSLPSNNFIKIHRSFVINKNKVDTIQGNILKIKHQTIPISTKYKEDLLKAIKII